MSDVIDKICDNIKNNRIDELQTQVNTLIDMYKNLSSMIAGTEDNHIRILHIEQYIKNHNEEDEFADDKIKKLEEKTKAVDEQQLHTHDCLLDYAKRIKTLEDIVCEHEGLINALRISYNNLCAPSLKKEPFTCPVCDGKCETINKTSLLGDSLTKSQRQDKTGLYDECIVCIGKGIVWG